MSPVDQFLEWVLRHWELCVHHRRHHHRLRLILGPFSTGKVQFEMPSQVSAPHGASGSAKLVPQPDGAAFTGTPKIVSSDPSVVVLQDNGDGTATLSVVGTEGQTCTITGSDDSFSDTADFTVAASAPPTETGVSLTVTFP